MRLGLSLLGLIFLSGCSGSPSSTPSASAGLQLQSAHQQATKGYTFEFVPSQISDPIQRYREVKVLYTTKLIEDYVRGKSTCDGLVWSTSEHNPKRKPDGITVAHMFMQRYKRGECQITIYAGHNHPEITASLTVFDGSGK